MYVCMYVWEKLTSRPCIMLASHFPTNFSSWLSKSLFAAGTNNMHSSYILNEQQGYQKVSMTSQDKLNSKHYLIKNISG